MQYLLHIECTLLVDKALGEYSKLFSLDTIFMNILSNVVKHSNVEHLHKCKDQDHRRESYEVLTGRECEYTVSELLRKFTDLWLA